MIPFMGLSGFDSNCKNHPNLKQLPGVCSSCLREKLAKLAPGAADFSSAIVYHSSSISSSPEFSSSVSSPPPKGGHAPLHRKTGSDAAFGGPVPVGLFAHGGASEADGMTLKKSRSMTCDPRIGSGNRRGPKDAFVNELTMGLELDGDKKKRNKKMKGGGGFWKRLIQSTSRKTKGVLMMQSKTVKEKPYY